MLKVVFVTTISIQCYYWICIFGRWAFEKTKTPNVLLPLEPVSIVICAKNEAENLKLFLPNILNQVYERGFEIIVVNDHSTDCSMAVLKVFQKQYDNLYVVDLRENKTGWRGKKNALHEGIKLAKYEWLLLTDADCTPVGFDWISEMQNVRNDSTEIVLGYAPYSFQSGFLNKIIQFETLHTALQYLSYAATGKPYMGVGRNLMYKKSLYEKFSFENFGHLVSGDDDLFVGVVANKDNTVNCIDVRTHIYSIPKVTWRDWYRQKTRHLSTGTSYGLNIKVLLGLYSASHAIIFTTLFVSFIFCDFTPIVGFSLLVRFLLVFIVFNKVQKKLNLKHIKLHELIIFEFFFVIYYITFVQSLWKKSNPNQW